MDRKSQARKTLRGLKQLYPQATCELNFGNPFELMVATILSAQCTDKRVNVVTAELFKRHKTPADFAALPQASLEREIRSTGFYRNKALSIRRAAKLIVEKHGGRVPKTMAELLELPGVARKTANVILGTAFGVADGVVVDTHMKRVAYRLGLTDETDPVKVERDLMAAVPRDEWIYFGHAMVWHGRRLCFARAPNCPECPLSKFCLKRGV